jgi:hypothetical protein
LETGDHCGKLKAEVESAFLENEEVCVLVVREAELDAGVGEIEVVDAGGLEEEAVLWLLQLNELCWS